MQKITTVIPHVRPMHATGRLGWEIQSPRTGVWHGPYANERSAVHASLCHQLDQLLGKTWNRS
jgi:hypothetical protein